MEEIYQLGLECMAQQNYKEAEKYLKFVYEDPQFQKKVASDLIRLCIKTGNYKKARELLENHDNNDPDFKILYGKLEMLEYNFEEGKKQYKYALQNSHNQVITLQQLALYYIKIENYEAAKKILETLNNIAPGNIQAPLGQIYICILEQNWKELQKLRMIKKPKEGYLNKEIEMCDLLISYFTKKKFPSINDTSSPYFLNRLVRNNEEELLGHLEKHKNNQYQKSGFTFFKYLDMKELLYDVKECMKDTQSIPMNSTKCYNIRLNSPIGYQEDKMTSDISVIAALGTNIIITMYPVEFSEKFDLEGLSSKKKFLQKKQGGGYNL